MATIDLKEFAQQKALVQQQATKDCAGKIQQVKVLLQEIKELVTLSGIVVDIRDINSDVEAIAELHPQWNSSSYDC